MKNQYPSTSRHSRNLFIVALHLILISCALAKPSIAPTALRASEPGVDETSAANEMIDLLLPIPPGVANPAQQIEAQVDGSAVTVLRYDHFDAPLYVLQAEVNPETGHDVTLKIKRKFHEARLHPVSSGFELDREGPRLRFSFTGTPYLVFECDGIGYMALLFEAPSENPDGTGIYLAHEAGIKPDPLKVQTDAIQSALDKVSASESLTTLRLGPGIYRSGSLWIPSNTRLHLDAGAVLKASDNPKDMRAPDAESVRELVSFINSDGAKNIAITGKGLIDGNRPVLDRRRYHKPLVALNNSQNIRLEGISFVDSCNWGITTRNCENIRTYEVKILNNRALIGPINTDGFNPDSSRNVLIERSFFHTGDDGVAVKSSGAGGIPPNNVSNVRVRDLLAINNSTTAKIGTETRGSLMEDIHFENIYAVQTCRLIAIDAYDVAEIRNVSFRNCEVAHLVGDWETPALVDLRAPQTSFRPIAAEATVDGVLLDSIHAYTPAKSYLTLRETEGAPPITNIDYQNVTAMGEPVPLEESAR